jgi:hypothetical protein
MLSASELLVPVNVCVSDRLLKQRHAFEHRPVSWLAAANVDFGSKIGHSSLAVSPMYGTGVGSERIRPCLVSGSP